ncbi:MAG: ABC transporter substrate-binding protein [Betaproteobacteria bacterium]|nr:MAG: ABC transporter substrate-binding protein [Betaproteobacteria bacterium]
MRFAAGSLVTILTLVLPAAPLIAQSQAPGRMYRIGWLGTAVQTEPERERLWGPFHRRLSELGYVEGNNTVVERRYSEGKLERFPSLAAELVRLNVDVIVTVGQPATQAAQKVTTTVPIVMTGVVDPVGAGIVASLARPSGNTTGLSVLSTDLVTKRLELLKAIVPEVSSVGVFRNPGNKSNELQFQSIKTTAEALKVRLQPIGVRGPNDVETAFQAATREQAGALVVLDDPVIYDQRAQIAVLAVKNRLPSVGGLTGFAEAGGLMSYGTNLPEHFRQAATYVDRILKGAKPADLPVEQPTKFELVINLKTAKTLGLTIPAALLVRADRVIE